MLCGRGGNATLHPGNVQFRILVDTYKEKYASASRCQKSKVANEVVDKWRSRRGPKNDLVGGRFLTLTDPSNKQTSLWHDVGNKGMLRSMSGSSSDLCTSFLLIPFGVLTKNLTSFPLLQRHRGRQESIAASTRTNAQDQVPRAAAPETFSTPVIPAT